MTSSSHTAFFSHASFSPLLLGSVGLVRLGLRPLLSDTDQPRLASCITQLPVRLLLAREVGNLALLDLSLVDDRVCLVNKLDVVLGAGLLSGLDLLGAGVTLLGLLAVAGEEDDTALVCLQALDVGGKRLLGQVLAAGVD